jgi:hypothetical protein
MKKIQTRYGLQFDVLGEIKLYAERELVCRNTNESFVFISFSPLKKIQAETCQN